jgi:hypothetical protein
MRSGGLDAACADSRDADRPARAFACVSLESASKARPKGRATDEPDHLWLRTNERERVMLAGSTGLETETRMFLSW